jgi:hypothetical protein
MLKLKPACVVAAALGLAPAMAADYAPPVAAVPPPPVAYPPPAVAYPPPAVVYPPPAVVVAPPPVVVYRPYYAWRPYAVAPGWHGGWGWRHRW